MRFDICLINIWLARIKVKDFFLKVIMDGMRKLSKKEEPNIEEPKEDFNTPDQRENIRWTFLLHCNKLII